MKNGCDEKSSYTRMNLIHGKNFQMTYLVMAIVKSQNQAHHMIKNCNHRLSLDILWDPGLKIERCIYQQKQEQTEIQ